jgi:hypothetical protein
VNGVVKSGQEPLSDSSMGRGRLEGLGSRESAWIALASSTMRATRRSSISSRRGATLRKGFRVLGEIRVAGSQPGSPYIDRIETVSSRSLPRDLNHNLCDLKVDQRRRRSK